MTTPIASIRPPAAATPQRAELKKAAQAFEAVFLRQLIGSMRTASLSEDILGSQATDQFRDMSDAKLADSMSEKGAFGIADLLIRQLGDRLPTAPQGDPE